MSMNNYTRRQFLKLGTRTFAGAGLALGANPLLTLAHAAEGSFNTSADYRALVCIFLQGGCDGFSLMVPTDNAEYTEYARSRGGLAVPRSQLLDISTLSGNAPSVGLHPSAAPLRELFNEGRLAMLANIGNLVEPVTREQYQNKSVQLPAQLFSHADQEIQWQQLQGRNRAADGWGALATQYLSAYQQRDDLTSITLAGSNYWQSGFGQRPFSLSETGVPKYQGLDENQEWSQPRIQAFRKVRDLQHNHVFASAYADIQNRAMNVTAELGELIDSNSPLTNNQPADNQLAARLGMVAQLIAVREQLGLRRQIFYVSMGGFDVHDNQNKSLPTLFSQLADAMAYFQATLDQIGQSDNVTTFTASDFGRALASNGDGTDHGWGNHLMAMGGAVRGSEIYGELPRLDVDGPDAVQHGRILPTLSATQYAGTLLDWVGLSNSEVDQVLPNLGNFNQRNLGFLS